MNLHNSRFLHMRFSGAAKHSAVEVSVMSSGAPMHAFEES